MNLYIRLICGKHCLNRLLTRLNDICSKNKMSTVEKTCDVYWKDKNCYEMDICLSPCPSIMCDEWVDIYKYLFHQTYSIEEDSFDITGGDNVILFNYAHLEELTDQNKEGYFVRFCIPRICIKNYHGKNSFQ